MSWDGIARDSQISFNLIQGWGWIGGQDEMAKPLSMDLRERAIARRDSGQTVRSVADALSISPSCVVKWSQRLKATGSVAPGTIGGRKPGLLRGDHAVWLRERASGADFTLRGLALELGERGLEVDYKTVWTFIHREGLSFKKKRSGKRARPS